jgi:hypothetical protein
MTVTKSHKAAWGSYTDRKNSYDDDDDINAFIQLCKNNSNLHQYLSSFMTKQTMVFKPKKDGMYGVDLSITVYTLSSSDSHTQRQYQRIADYTTQHTQSQAIYLAQST